MSPGSPPETSSPWPTGGPLFALGLVTIRPTNAADRLASETDQIAAVLGYCPYDEAIHRDNLAVIDRASRRR